MSLSTNAPAPFPRSPSKQPGGLNANLHFHTLALDGVFSEGPGGALAFHPAPAPSDTEVAEALAAVRHRVRRLLVRRGLEPGVDATGPVGAYVTFTAPPSRAAATRHPVHDA